MTEKFAGAGSGRHKTRPDRAAPLTVLLVAGRHGAHALPAAPFSRAGLTVERAVGLDDAARTAARLAPQIVFVPVTLEGQSSADLLAQLLGGAPAPVVVVIATNDEINAAAEAMRAGAADCLFRPFSDQRLARTIDEAIRAVPAALRDRAPRGLAPSEPGKQMRVERPGDNRPMAVLHDRAMALAGNDLPVFISGETGTGKSTLAREIHAASRRAGAPFVTIDCPSLTADSADRCLAEARRDMEGGTLFLDGIGELDPALQPRVVKLIAAETADPPRLIASTRLGPDEARRRLRPELFYRLYIAPIALPPLRERRGDVATIVQARLAELAEARGRPQMELSDAARARLEAYDWPGNLHELLGTVTDIALGHDTGILRSEHLPQRIARPAVTAGEAAPGLGDFAGMTLEEIERQVIEATIRAQGGSVPAAAAALGVAPSTIYRKRAGWARAGAKHQP